MRALNARVEVDHEPIASVARAELAALGFGDSAQAIGKSNTAEPEFVAYLSAHRAELTSQFIRHVMLVLIALIAGIIVAVPLGLLHEFE